MSTPLLVFSPAALRRERQRAGLTQHALTIAAGMHGNSISRIELGASSPMGNTVARLAAALGCPMEALYEPQEEQEAQAS